MKRYDEPCPCLTPCGRSHVANDIGCHCPEVIEQARRDMVLIVHGHATPHREGDRHGSIDPTIPHEHTRG